MSEHTPGPWTTDGHMIEATDHTGHRITVASVNSCWHCCGTREGNAALASAAPDYHAAVSDLLALWPLSGYELEAYLGATFIPAVIAAHAKATKGATP